jgi:ABC-type antimicrobial peptide transport system permease subunit
MGIRLALGATPSGLRRAVIGRTGVMILVSAIAGAGLALAAGRYLGSLIPGAEQGLAATSTLAGSIMIGVAAAAIWSATRQVSRLDVSDVLRAESPD